MTQETISRYKATPSGHTWCHSQTCMLPSVKPPAMRFRWGPEQAWPLTIRRVRAHKNLLTVTIWTVA
jgi:hypothetical protein